MTDRVDDILGLRLQRAIEAYEAGESTISRAAEMAGVGWREMRNALLAGGVKLRLGFSEESRSEELGMQMAESL